MSNHNDPELMSKDLMCDLCPPNQDYKVKHLKQKDQSEENFNFELDFRVNLKTECVVKEFVAALHHSLDALSTL